MVAAELIKDLRTRAGLTQAELARRLGTSQPAIARWEAAKTEPGFENLLRVAHRCGFELLPQLVERPSENALNIRAQLALTPAQRLVQLVNTVRFFERGRASHAIAADGRRSASRDASG